jgi:hypothetical protein
LENFFTCCIHPGTVGLPTLAFATTLGQIRTALAITTTQYSGGDQFYVTFKYIMKDGRVFTNTNSNANVVGGAYMRSPFKYTLNVVCPITESLAGAHTYVTTMKAGSGGGVSGASCGGTVTGTVTFEIQQHQEFTLQRILDSVNLDRLVGAIVLQHLLELE